MSKKLVAYVNDIVIVNKSMPEDWNCPKEVPEWIEYAFVYRFDGWEHIVRFEKIVQE